MGCRGMVEEEDPYSLDLCGIILAREESLGSFFYAVAVDGLTSLYARGGYGNTSRLCRWILKKPLNLRYKKI